MGWQQGKERLLKQVQQQIQSELPDDEATPLIGFLHQFYDQFPVEDLGNRSVEDLYGAVSGSWKFIQQLDPDSPRVRLFNPNYEQHGWQSKHTVVAIVCRNMPFITDSVRGELNRRNTTIHTVHSCIYNSVRDKQHKLVRLVENGQTEPNQLEEVLLYLEIGRNTDERELNEIADVLLHILSEVAVVVEDHHAMVEKARLAISDIDNTPKANREVIEEYQLFINWLIDDHFTFLGYEEIVVDGAGTGTPVVSQNKQSELGLLKIQTSHAADQLQDEISRAESPEQLISDQIICSKSPLRSRVHRFVYPDIISVKCFDREGRIISQHRFLGLYTSQVYTLSPKLIPVVRQKIATVFELSGLDVKSHSGRNLERLLEVFPREELFQSSVDELFKITMDVNAIRERRQVRLFARKGFYGKFVNCTLYIPRDIYQTALRKKIENLLCDAFGASESEFTTFFSESILVRTHFVLRVDSKDLRDVDIKSLEEEVVNVTMSWQDHLRNHLLEEFGEEQGAYLCQDYCDAFPPGYMDDFDSRMAIVDIKKISALNSNDDIAMSFYRGHGEKDNEARFRLFHLNSPLALSDVMPILEHLGLRVVSERPYGLKFKDGRQAWIHEFSLIYSLSEEFDISKVGENFQDAFYHIWYGHAESDAFNKLILGAQIGWRQVAMLRAYSRYMKQIKFSFGSRYIAETLCDNLVIAASIVDFFYIRFDPKLPDTADKRKEREDNNEEGIIKALGGVENLNQDKIIRNYLSLILATQRTNYFQRDEDGRFKEYFSFKFMPELIPDMPLPVPLYEIFVYSPRIEGVHLRGGRVARGGLRWSDRHEDFRTEVLGLVKAQQVKNAVIVPAGAKGGFVAKRLPADEGREAIMKEGINCYRTFIRGLLDLTDNRVNGEIIPPREVVRKDQDDTYLVVAADKGTATFSDIANEISHEYDFWLGDAFASGGSVGYDHKKMGITAKGAWVSVQRHFREMGVNVQQEDFTVVGIGDMSGDVFGNGMLLSEHIQLLCAFNHLHIFIDPSPDAAISFKERKRLFELPRSSWSDYNAELISKGGGIFKRSAKAISISPEMKERFGLVKNSLTPDELIKHILSSPYDLLWNGGIGTYAKSSTESHSDVGDKANDSLRVDAKDLQCKVIGEGGNLGITQLARVEFSLNGGHCNTDFIDNAAGVDCSDHEVNIKILLNDIVLNDDMTYKQRNELLEDMTDSVAKLVLENNYRQTQAISMAEHEALERVGEYRRLIQGMEASGKLNRQLEFIPDDEKLIERKNDGKSLTRPELSVLISYAKTQLKEELVDSFITENEYIGYFIETAFPEQLNARFSPLIHQHRLSREIIATQVANDVVNTMGITFIDRMVQSTGVSSTEVVAAYIAAVDVFEMKSYWQKIEALDYTVSSEIQMELMAGLIRLVRRATRWFIRNRRAVLDPAVEAANFKQPIKELSRQQMAFITGPMREAWHLRTQHFIEAGVPEELSRYVAGAQLVYPCLGIVEAAQEMKSSTLKVANVYFSLSQELDLDWFARQVGQLKVENYWQAMARESFRDDLEWQLRKLTVGAMRYLDDQDNITACIERWLEQQDVLVKRWRAMLLELHAVEAQDFAMISVAIRELLDMAQSSEYGEIA